MSDHLLIEMWWDRFFSRVYSVRVMLHHCLCFHHYRPFFIENTTGPITWISSLLRASNKHTPTRKQWMIPRRIVHNFIINNKKLLQNFIRKIIEICGTYYLARNTDTSINPFWCKEKCNNIPNTGHFLPQMIEHSFWHKFLAENHQLLCENVIQTLFQHKN